jgi:hypothetical protein
MKLAVLLYRDTVNVNNIPGEWPAEVSEVEDNVTINSPLIEMTVEQYNDYRYHKQHLYDAWEEQYEVSNLKPIVIDKLWQSAYDYNFQFFSAGAFARILELKLAGSQKAIETDAWIMGLWSDYYTRKYTAINATTSAELNNIDLDFSNNGNPPWTILEMLS